MIITIDGPSGSGKSTVSRMLARRLGFTYVDTGALYRGMALILKEDGVDLEDEAALRQKCSSIQIHIKDEREDFHVIANGKDLTEAIRRPEVAQLASLTSTKKAVREALLGLQRALGKRGRAVFEGRDIGTVVFPDAPIKFYLDASLYERSLRRYLELAAKKQEVSFNEVLEGIAVRDREDSTRELAPLRVPDDALLIDSTNMSAEEVVEKMIEIIDRKSTNKN